MSGVTIRPERRGDEVAVEAVNVAAFPGRAEADLVAALRRDGDLVLSLVAEDEAGIVGHLAFSRLAGGAGLKVCALAPVAVVPARQRQGIGSRLIAAGLDALGTSGEDAVLVLGDPDFYGRFGFTPDAARAFATPYDGPYQQALRLGSAGGGAELRYPAAFSGL